MKNIHNFQSFINENQSSELDKFLATFNKYCDEKKEQKDVRERALQLIDEINEKDPDGLIKWMTQGKTLALQGLLRKTTYRGNGNDPDSLRDFNAFALLDTVRTYN